MYCFPKISAVLESGINQALSVLLLLLQRGWHGPVRITRLSCWSVAREALRYKDNAYMMVSDFSAVADDKI